MFRFSKLVVYTGTGTKSEKKIRQNEVVSSPWSFDIFFVLAFLVRHINIKNTSKRSDFSPLSFDNFFSRIFCLREQRKVRQNEVIFRPWPFDIFFTPSYDYVAK